MYKMRYLCLLSSLRRHQSRSSACGSKFSSPSCLVPSWSGFAAPAASASASSFSTSSLWSNVKTTTKMTSSVSLFLSTYLVPHSQIWFRNHKGTTTYRRESSPPKNGSTESEKPGNFKEKPVDPGRQQGPVRSTLRVKIVVSLLKSKYGLKKSPL